MSEPKDDILTTWKMPDLQEWVARYGSHQNIEWKAWDEAMAAWREQRRQELKEELARLRVQV